MTDGLGRIGSQIKRQYGAMEVGPKWGGWRRWGNMESEMEKDRGGQTGSGSHIWHL